MYDNTKSLKQSLNTRDFFKFCKKEFSSNMESLEKNRRLCITRFVVVSIILIICITLIFFECKYHYIVYNTIRDLDIEVLYLLPSIPFLAMSFTALFLLYIPKNYKNQSKNLIMGKLLSYIGDFRVDNSSNYKYVKSLQLFRYFNIYKCDDCFSGIHNTLKVKILELELKYVKKSGKYTYADDIFNGILITFPCLKQYKGQTFIFRNSLIPDFHCKRVHLESPEFEKLYDVFSTDQVEARYLITTAFMQRLVKLEQKGFKGLTMSFEQGNVNIAIPSNKDWFEVPLLKSAYDINNYRSILFEIITILSIIDSLKLDKNIGL